MSKWFGKIGYFATAEVTPGYWEESVVEKDYFGDALRVSSRLQSNSNTTNDDISINVQISLIGDPFAYANFSTIKYAEYMGTKWKITSVDVQFPRLILNLGGVYNGQQT